MMRIFIPLVMLGFLGCVALGVHDGETAFRLKKYNLAVTLYKEEYAKEQDKVKKKNMAFRIAESYRFMNDPVNAEPWYETAVSMNHSLEAIILYAQTLKQNGKYDAAITVYRQLIREEPLRQMEFTAQINACEMAKLWAGSESRTRIVNLETINTNKAEFSPVVYESGALVFSSSRVEAKGDKKDEWTGNHFYDLFYSAYVGTASFAQPRGLSDLINSPFNEASATFNEGFTVMYYTQCGQEGKSNDICQVFRSDRLPDGGWSAGELVTLFPERDSINTGHPFLSRDGKMLLYAANDADGLGGADLYYSLQAADGWGLPINLGAMINTAAEEGFPFLDEEGNLYFSSAGHPGLGGMDLFRASREKEGWGSVEPLRAPVNSNADDFGIFIIPLTTSEKDAFDLKGYFSSSRDGGKGLDDVYYFELPKAPPLYEVKGRVLEKILADSTDPNSKVLGFKPLSGATLKLIETGATEISLGEIQTNEKGGYYAKIEFGKSYKLLASREPKYLKRSEKLSSDGKKAAPGEVVTYEVDIILDRKSILVGMEIEIPNIYYDFNDWKIRPDAAQVLDTSIFVLMKENPGLVVELGSHTDSRGAHEFNDTLSNQRARSVVNYLVSKGIHPGRLKWKGSGERFLVNECKDDVECPEEDHQKNRRTTFRILGDDFSEQ